VLTPVRPKCSLLYAFDFAVQEDGRIVLVGGVGSQVAIARYLANGHADPTFGRN